MRAPEGGDLRTTGRRPSTLAALALVAAALAGCTDRRDPQPNVLVVVTDDQRAEALAGMRFTSRWFRRLGVVYESAYVTTPLCCPSRASILTGRYAHNHRVRGNGGAGKLDGDTTLPRYLEEVGYRTAIAGKYLTNWDLEERPPGFDHWLVFNHGYESANFGSDTGVESITRYSTDVVADAAVRFLRDFEEADSDPWFLYVAPMAPHPPFTPAPRYEAADVAVPAGARIVAERSMSDKPRFLATRELGEAVPPPLRGSARILHKGRIVRALQLRTLMSVDDMLERLVRTMRTLDEASSTLVVFTSDNGYLWGEHRSLGKRVPYEPSIRVPLAVRFPADVAPPGDASERLVLNVDIAPTVAELAGVEHLRAPMDGESLLSRGDRRAAFIEHWMRGSDIPDWRSIRTRRHKLVEYLDAHGRVLFREFYDLRADPDELRNLLGDRDDRNDPAPALIGRLSRRAERLDRCFGRGCP